MHTLPDGTPILIRAHRAGRQGRGSRSRSAASARRRSTGASSPPSRASARAELRYLTEVDGRDHIALVAFLADDPETIVAVARCVRLPDAPDTAEFAIVVGDPLQGRGLGSLLARELATAARSAGIRRFAATMLGENVAVRRLMRTISRARWSATQIADGVREVVVELAA